MSRYKFNCYVILLFLLISVQAALALPQAEELNRKAKIAIQNGRYKDAIKMLKQAMALDPKWGEPYYNAAQLLRIKNKKNDERRALKKAWTLEPDNDTYSDAYAKSLKYEMDVAIKQGNKSEVSRIRKIILQVQPTDVKVGISILTELIKQKKTDEAKKLALKILAKNGSLRTKYNSEPMGQLFYILARLEIKSGDLYKARNYAENANKFSFADPDIPKKLLKSIKQKQEMKAKTFIDKANEKLKNGDRTGALMMLRQAKKITPYDENIQKQIDSVGNAKEAAGALKDAKALIQKGSWLEAADLLEYVVDADPSNTEAKELCNKALRVRKKLLNKIGKSEVPEDNDHWANIIDYFYTKGKREKEAGGNKTAKIEFDKALAIIKLNKSMEPYRAKIEKEMKQINAVENRKDIFQKGLDARNAYKYEDCIKYLTQLPRDYDIQIPSYLAEAYWKTGDEEKAKSLARYQLNKQPENNRAKFVLGCIYLENGDKERAYKYLKQVYDSDSEYPGVRDKLASAAASTKGRQYFFIALMLLLFWIAYFVYKKIPVYNKNAVIGRGKKALKNKQYDECIEELGKIRRSPLLTEFDGALISRLLAQAYLKKGRYDLAVGECKHLIGINPNDKDAHMWLGYAYLGRRNIGPESLPELLNLYKLEPKNVALVSLLGSHYTKQKILSDEGIKILEQWLKLEPNNLTVLKPLGRHYLSKGKTDEKATNVFEKMMELGSAEPEFLLGVAKIKLKLRKFDECLKLCEEVLSKDVNNEIVHSVLREAYHKQDKLHELIEIYKNFLQTNPYNVAFQKGLKETQKLVDALGANNSSGAAGEGASSQAIICPHCQKPNPPNEYYCQGCGKSLT